MGDIWGGHWDPLGTLWDPLGTLWDHLGVPWVPFGVPWEPFGTTLAVFRPPWASFWRILALFYVILSAEGAQKVLKRCFFVNYRVFLEIFRKHCRLWLVTNAVLLLVFFVLRWTERSEAERGRSKLIALHILPVSYTHLTLPTIYSV